MKFINNSLIELDRVFGPVSKLFLYFFVRWTKKEVNKRVLVIKFLGAGNFIQLADLNCKEWTFLTLRENAASISLSHPHAQIIQLDFRSPTAVFDCIVRIFSLIFTSRWGGILNLECESSFARFLTGVTPSYKKYGLTTRHKDYLDSIVYSSYVVVSDFFSLSCTLS